MNNNRKCPVCKKEDFKIYKRDVIREPNKYIKIALVLCNECGNAYYFTED